MLIDEEIIDNDDCCIVESLSLEFDQDKAEYCKKQENAKLSLNAMSRIQNLTFMRVMTWRKFEVTLLVNG